MMERLSQLSSTHIRKYMSIVAPWHPTYSQKVVLPCSTNGQKDQARCAGKKLARSFGEGEHSMENHEGDWNLVVPPGLAPIRSALRLYINIYIISYIYGNVYILGILKLYFYFWNSKQFGIYIYIYTCIYIYICIYTLIYTGSKSEHTTCRWGTIQKHPYTRATMHKSANLELSRFPMRTAVLDKSPMMSMFRLVVDSDIQIHLR